MKRQTIFIILQILFVLNYMDLVRGAQSIERVNLVRNGTHCLWNDKEWKVDSTWADENECLGYHCTKDGNSQSKGLIIVTSCGSVAIAGCKTLKPKFPKAKHPKCCELICAD